MLTRRETISVSSTLGHPKSPESKSKKSDEATPNFYALSSFSTAASSKPGLTFSKTQELIKSDSIAIGIDKEVAIVTPNESLSVALTPSGIEKFTYPASIREDLWQTLLNQITFHELRPLKQIINCLKQIEHYWGSVGCKYLDRIEQLCPIGNWEKASELTSRQLESMPLHYIPDSPQFYVLVVHPPVLNDHNNTFSNIATELRSHATKEEYKFPGYEHTHSGTHYSIVEVSSAREALLAVLINPDILATVICDNVPAIHTLSNHKKPESLVEFEDFFLTGIETLIKEPLNLMNNGSDVLTTLVEAIHSIRAEMDMYTVCSNSQLMNSEILRFIVARCFVALEDHSELHEAILNNVRKRREAPFFQSLKAYAEKPIGVFHALAVSRGNSVRQSRWIQELGQFYGLNLFKAESSATCGGLDSLLDPHGALKDAQLMAASTFGAQFLFFTTNGTSTSNKIVCQAITRPSDIVLVDKACHKSHHYSFVLQGARPCYLDPYPLQEYSMYGGVPLNSIKYTLLAYKKAGLLHKVTLLTLTNCTFDGITYNVQRLIEECLAIKPDLCFLFDEAWFAYAYFHPIFKSRTAMNSANVIRERIAAGQYNQKYSELCERLCVSDLDEVDDIELLINERLYPNPDKAIVRVYATQSTHKSLTSLRQGSMILCNDDLFESKVHTAFKESYYTHMSTSPNYQIIASMDMGRVQMDLEGYKLVQRQIEAALRIRFMVDESSQVSSYFSFLNTTDMIPLEHRQTTKDLFDNNTKKMNLNQFEKSWLSEDFFVLDPTRLTLYIGESGIDGETFKVDWLMNKYGIQVNKTSRNSVLFQTNIGTDRSSCLFLVQCLERAVNELMAIERLRSDREEKLSEKMKNSLTIYYPKLPSTNYFHKKFINFISNNLNPSIKHWIRDGDIRTPYYLSYDDSVCEYFEIFDAQKRIQNGENLVASTFLIPYPPGFPIAVPGQLLTNEIIEFLLNLDVKEIHGYDSQLGLRCFKEEILHTNEDSINYSQSL